MDDLREPTDVGPVRVHQTHTTTAYGITITPLAVDTLPRLARLLADTGMLEEFAILGRNRAATGVRAGQALTTIERATRTGWADAAAIDLTPEHALTLAAQLERHAEEPPECDLRIECGGDWATVQVSPTRFACVPCSQHINETAVA